MGAVAAPLVMSANSIQQSSFQSKNLKMQGKFQESQNNFNADMADIQAEDAVKRGDNEAVKLLQQANGIKGQQRVTAATNGVDVSSGSALDVQRDTEALSALDAIQIRNNAWREAFGYKVQAVQSRQQGTYASLAARNAANATIATGGMQALSYGAQAYGEYQKAHPKSTKLPEPPPTGGK